MDIKQVQEFIEKKPMIAYPALAISALVIWSILMMFEPKKQEVNAPTVEKDMNIGLSVGGVDQQAYMERLEKNYYDFESRVKTIEEQVKSIKSLVQDVKVKQKESQKTLEERISTLQESKEDTEVSDPSSFELAIANINPVQEKNDSVYLPMGSFCKGTLLTGVYASADTNNALPVLIQLEEAFYGPNKTRIPLKGSFVLGKAVGDLVSERALIQIVAISSVLPDGKTFEIEEKLGYVTDQFGELGIKGRVVTNTGKQLALSFLGGFSAGGAQAIADGEVTTTRDDDGDVTRDVTGSTAKNAVFSGLSRSAGQLAEYYEKQAENLVPAVHIGNGSTVYFIVQKGVNIYGLPRTDYALSNHLN
jgi:hypothetical protein